MNNTDTPAAPRNTEEQLVRHDRICERAATCDKLNSDGEPCRHGMPHKRDYGCDVGFRVHNWRDRWPAPNEWGLRIEFWRWHLCFALKLANKPGEPRSPAGETNGH